MSGPWWRPCGACKLGSRRCHGSGGTTGQVGLDMIVVMQESSCEFLAKERVIAARTM